MRLGRESGQFYIPSDRQRRCHCRRVKLRVRGQTVRLSLWLIVTGMNLALLGCAPFPHLITIVPELSGIVTESGIPLNNVSVYLSESQSNPCRETSAPVHPTNSAGSFKLERVSQFRFLYAPMVAPISVSEFALCIATSSQHFLGFRGLTRSYGESEPRFVICDTKRPRVFKNRFGISEESICELSKSTPH